MFKLSVIIPVYKVPLEYLRVCLNSLVSQTLQECEFIIVSDGAPDTETSICEEYAKKDSRFKFFKREHAGVSAARNFGLTQAQGEYICYVDADDFLYSNTSLERTYEIVQKNHSDIILFDWITKGKDPLSLWPEDKTILSDTEKEECLKQLIHIQNLAFSGAPWAKLYKRSFLSKNSLSFNPNLPIGEDRVFNYKAISLASKISYVKEVLYIYVINKDSTIQRYRPDILFLILKYIEELNIVSNGKYLNLIGRETLFLFYFSWKRFYMHPNNNESYLKRMKDISSIVLSNSFQELIQSVDTTNLSILFKIEAWLFQHKITFPIWLHGFKFKIINLFKRA